MTHKLKILEDFASAIVENKKTFEVRENSRGFQAGDFIEFIPVDRKVKHEIFDHPIRDKEYQITYVLSDWGIKEGYVAFGIKEIKDE